MKRLLAAAMLGVLLMVSVGLSAFAPRPQDEFEDRPVIIISSGSVILNVARGSWAREAAGRYRQEVPRGRDVTGFSASTGSGAAACTVGGTSLIVTYGTNAITIGRQDSSGQPGQRRAALVRLQSDAGVTLKGAQTLVIETADALVSVSNGGTRPEDTCRVAGGRLEVRQLH